MDLTNNKELLITSLKALRKEIDEKGKNRQPIKNIFDDEETSSSRGGIFFVISLFKIPDLKKDGSAVSYRIQIPVPHCFIDNQADVLLITKDKRGCKGLRSDHEPSIHHFTDVLKSHDALDLVTQVMPLKQLRTEFKDYEAKRALSNRFDFVLCDRVIINRLPLFLGRSFYGRKKIPVGVDFRKRNLQSTIKNTLSKVYMFMNLRGACSMAQFGRLDQTDEKLVENLSVCLEDLRSKLPGKWDNVRSVHIKTRSSPSVPLYVSMKSPNEVEGVVHPRKPFTTKSVVDYVNIGGNERLIEVFADGTIDIDEADIDFDEESLPEEEPQTSKPAEKKSKVGKMLKKKTTKSKKGEKSDGKTKKKGTTKLSKEKLKENLDLEQTKRKKISKKPKELFKQNLDAKEKKKKKVTKLSEEKLEETLNIKKKKMKITKNTRQAMKKNVANIDFESLPEEEPQVTKLVKKKSKLDGKKTKKITKLSRDELKENVDLEQTKKKKISKRPKELLKRNLDTEDKQKVNKFVGKNLDETLNIKKRKMKIAKSPKEAMKENLKLKNIEKTLEDNQNMKKIKITKRTKDAMKENIELKKSSADKSVKVKRLQKKETLKVSKARKPKVK